MKKYFILLTVALVLLATGCKKDDDDKPTDVTTEIAGDYYGNITLAGAAVAENVIIKLTREDDTHVTISMNETIEVPAIGQLPLNVECKKANVLLNNETYTISGETVVELNLGTGITSYNISVNGTIKNKTANLTITINMGVLPIAVQFTGIKHDGTEPEPEPDHAAAIAGEYNGNITMAGTAVAENVIITLTREDNTHLTISMNETLEVPVVGQLPLDVQCQNATIALSEQTYTISGETVVELNLGNGATEYNVSINGNIENNTANLAITINMGAVPVTVQFTGTK